MEKNNKYIELLESIVEKTKKMGADDVEALISESRSVQINVSGRNIESVRSVQDAGLGIRILKDQRMIFGSSNDLSEGTLTDLISDLMRKLRFHTADEFNIIPGEESARLSAEWADYSEMLSYDPEIDKIPVQEKIDRAISLEQHGLDYSPLITGSMTTVYQDSTVCVYLSNSNSITGWFPTSYCGGSVYISAAKGDDHQSGSFSQGRIKYNDFNPEEVGKKAAENAVRMLGAKPIESCEMPMVISPEVGIQILSYIVGMLSADRIQKGKSLFAEKLETEVASNIINITDDGRLKHGLATNPVDGEGIPRQTTQLITNGVLKNYLYDSYTAKKGNVKSTGNCSRGGYQSPGSIGSTNLYMQNGGQKAENILSSISKGFYWKDAIGLHAGIDPTSGDFSIPVAGFMIEKGEITFPIRGISIGGNLFNLLKSVDSIADDLTWFHSVGCPTFSVSNISIGGVA